jgi:hypothetical protein
LDGLGEVCDELILLKTHCHPTVWIRRLGEVDTFVRQSNTPVERIILDDVLGRKVMVLSEVIAYFLKLIQEFGKLVSFGYDLPEPCDHWVSPFILKFIMNR